MECGCEVAIVGTSDKVYETAEEFNKRGFHCHGVKADFSVREQVYSGFAECVEKLGGDLDILVNAHGIQRRHSAEVFPIEEWDEVLNVNLNSVFILCQEAAKIMLKKGYGKIINIASMVSWFGGQTVPAYSAAKGGVTQMTKEMSNDWIARGINVNAIAPGYMATKMNEALLDKDNPRYQQITERIPANRCNRRRHERLLYFPGFPCKRLSGRSNHSCRRRIFGKIICLGSLFLTYGFKHKKRLTHQKVFENTGCGVSFFMI